MNDKITEARNCLKYRGIMMDVTSGFIKISFFIRNTFFQFALLQSAISSIDQCKIYNSRLRPCHSILYFCNLLIIHNRKIVRIDYSIVFQTSLCDTQIRYFEIRTHTYEIIGQDETSYTNDSTW